MLVTLTSLGLWAAASGRFLLSPKWGVLWIIMFFAFSPRSMGFGVGGGGFALSSRRMLLLSFLGFLLLLILSGRIPLRGRIPHLLKPALGAIVLALFAATISSLIFTGGFFFVVLLMEDVLVIAVALLAAFVMSQTPKGDWKLVLYIFLIPVAVNFFIVLIEIQAKTTFMSMLLGGAENSSIARVGERNNLDGNLYFRHGRFRVGGLLGGPLTLAEYLVYASVAFVAMFYRRHITWPVLTVLLAMTAFMIFNTGSRGNLFAWTVAMLIMVMVHVGIHGIARKFVVQVFVGGLLSVVLISIGYTVATLEEVEFLYLMEREARSTYARFSQYAEVAETLMQSPLVGFGINRHPVFDLPVETSLITLDNHYLGVLLRSGLIGFLSLIFLIYYCLRVGLRHAFSPRYIHSRALGYWMLGTIVPFLFLKIVLLHSYNHIFLYTVMFFVLIEMSKAENAQAAVARAHQPPRPSPRRYHLDPGANAT